MSGDLALHGPQPSHLEHQPRHNLGPLLPFLQYSTHRSCSRLAVNCTPTIPVNEAVTDGNRSIIIVAVEHCSSIAELTLGHSVPSGSYISPRYHKIAPDSKILRSPAV